MTMLIGGDYNGGYVSNPSVSVSPPFISQVNRNQPTDSGVLSSFAADPVRMSDGAFYLSTTDLAVGQAAPRGLSLTRSYNSARRRHNLAGLAHGWTHSYVFNLAEVSAPEAGLGGTTPAQMAPMLVATRAAYELYSTNTSPKNWLLTTLIAKWGVDQLINNAVSVTLGEDMVQFIKQPDGRFTPPAGSTMTMIKTNSAYQLAQRHGNTFKFDSSRRLTNIVDQYSKSLTLAYNASNWVETATDWKGRTFTFSYTGTPARLTSVSDDTRTVSYGYGTAYSAQGDLTSVTDPESKTSTFVYDTNHQMIATRNAASQIVTSNAYDGFGRVIEQYSQGLASQTWRLYWSGFANVEEDPAGARRRFFYDDKSRQIGQQDALGNINWTEYDGQDHVVQTVSPLLETNVFQYDGNHNLLRAVDPLGLTNQFRYDALHRRTNSIDACGNTHSYEYNAYHQVTKSTDPLGNDITFLYNAGAGTLQSRTEPGNFTTSYGYDGWGQLNRITSPDTSIVYFTNNVWGDVIAQRDALGNVTTNGYNLRRELLLTVGPTNLAVSTTYDPVGNVATVTDARGYITSNTWSATKKLLTTSLPSTPDGVPVVSYGYNSRDWRVRTVNPLSQTNRLGYDAAGQVISTRDPLNRTNTFAYDADGRQTNAANPLAQASQSVYSPRGERVALTDPSTNTMTYGYDANGNQLRLTNRQGGVWKFAYDANNRLTNRESPLGQGTAWEYSPRGLLTRITEPSGQAMTNTYDGRARLTNQTDGLGARAYTYDANGNLLRVSEAGQTNAWTYDAYDRVATCRDADGNLLQYRYDVSGNLRRLYYPDGRYVRYTYDSLNRLTNVTDWANRETSLEYDLAGQLTRIIRPNGTVREIAYDAAGQTTNLLERLANGTPITKGVLNWDEAGRMTWEFAAPLPHPSTEPPRDATYDADNRLLTWNTGNVTHDADGNMTYGPGTNNTFLTYSYDARNRLLGVGGLQYGYDPVGNRTAVTNGATVTRFVVNPNAALSQVLMRVKGGVTNYYVYGLGLLYEITETATTTNTLTYHADYRGSTVALTDDNGAVKERFEYSAYGTLTYRSSTNDTPFLFNGRYGVQTDPNGLLSMRARYYNPYLCRFINADPSGFEGGLNFYAYADGNPVSYLDPFGLWSGEAGGSHWMAGTAIPPMGGYSRMDVPSSPWGYSAPSSSSSIPPSVIKAPDDRNPFCRDALAIGFDHFRGTEQWYGAASLNSSLYFTAMTAGIGTAAKSETTLFRVVGPDELSGIQQAGRYTPSPGGLESKYFYPTAEQAANFAANPANRQFGPFTLTSTRVPTSVINPADTINVAREGTVITLPNSTLPTVPTPTIHPSIPLPGPH